MTRGEPRVVVIGESILDVVEGPAGRRVTPGGSPANVAVGLARLEVDTRLVTRWGDDEGGALLRDHLRSAGVALDDAPPARRTSTAVATIAPDGSARYVFDIDWSLPDGIELGHPAIIHTGSIATFLEPGAESIRTLLDVRDEHTLVSYDPNIRPAIIGSRETELPAFERMARSSDLVKLSAEDAAWLYPDRRASEVLLRILALGPRLAVLTDGESGAHLATTKGSVFVPSIAVDVVDTIGAGDTYMASLIASILALGLSALDGETLVRIGRRAAAAAALCVMRPGAQPPTVAEVEDLLLGVPED